MKDALPPSKYGAGYTYSGPPETHPPQTASPYGQPYHTPTAPPSFSAQPTPGPGFVPGSATPTQPAASYGSYPANPAGYGAATPGYGTAAARPPSGGVPVSAAILAMLSAIYQGWQSYSFITVMSLFGAWGQFEQSAAKNYMVVMVVLSGAASLSYFLGSVMLLNRNVSGSGWITFGSLAALGQVVATLVFINATLHDLANWLSALVNIISPRASSPGTTLFGVNGIGVGVALGLTIGVPVLIAILAQTRATRRWCTAPRLMYGP